MGVYSVGVIWDSTVWMFTGLRPPRFDLADRVLTRMGVYSLGVCRWGSTVWGSMDLVQPDLDLAEYSPEWGSTVWGLQLAVYSLEVYRSHATRLGSCREVTGLRRYIYRTCACTSCLGK